MKLITALIKPFFLDKLSRKLIGAPITGFTVTDARGYGQAREEDSVVMDLLSPRVRIEMVVLDDNVDAVTELIYNTCSTHQEGDGILFVTAVEAVTNIRTGARGPEALKI